MAAPIVISIDSDAAGAVKGVEDVDAALTKTTKSLESVTTGGAKSTDELEASFRQYTTAVQQESTKQTEAVEISSTEQNRIQRESVKAGAAATAETLAQTASGFDGTLQGGLSTLTNIGATLSAVLPPEFAAVAVLGTLAFSAISGAITNGDESAKNFTADVASLADQMIKAGNGGAISFSDLTSNLQALATQTDPTKASLADLFDTAKSAGASATDLADAYAGDTDQLKQLDDEAKKKLELDKQDIELYGTRFEKSKLSLAQLHETTDAQSKYVDYLDDTVRKQNAATTTTDEYDKAVKALGPSTVQSVAEQKAALEAGANAFSDIGSKIQSEQDGLNAAATAASEKTKKTVVANNVETADSFIAEQAKELSALLSANANKIDIYEKFGKDAGAAVIKDVGNNPQLLAALAAASPADVQKIKDQYSAAGKAAGENLTKAAQIALTANQAVGNIKINADTTDAKKSIASLTSSKQLLNIVVNSITTKTGVKLF